MPQQLSCCTWGHGYAQQPRLVAALRCSRHPPAPTRPHRRFPAARSSQRPCPFHHSHGFIRAPGNFSHGRPALPRRANRLSQRRHLRSCCCSPARSLQPFQGACIAASDRLSSARPAFDIWQLRDTRRKSDSATAPIVCSLVESYQLNPQTTHPPTPPFKSDWSPSTAATSSSRRLYQYRGPKRHWRWRLSSAHAHRAYTGEALHIDADQLSIRLEYNGK